MAPDWKRTGVTVASRGPARRRGLAPRPAGRAILIRGRVVHGIGMRETIVAVGIDADGRVLAIRHLAPGRLAVLSGASWVLELPGDEAGPGIGSMLGIIAAT